jgi:hypothetical protein
MEGVTALETFIRLPTAHSPADPSRKCQPTQSSRRQRRLSGLSLTTFLRTEWINCGECREVRRKEECNNPKEMWRGSDHGTSFRCLSIGLYYYYYYYYYYYLSQSLFIYVLTNIPKANYKVSTSKKKKQNTNKTQKRQFTS